MTPSIAFEAHPLLDASAFLTSFPRALADCPTPAWLAAELAPAPGPEDLPAQSEEVRQAVRRLLRQGGYRPTGRGKPASEYLARAAGEGALGPINLAVDACNAVSLATGLPISVVDVELAAPPWSVRLARAGESYVFNAAGQAIELEGLLVLCDAQGPCANAVKDSQRTKTHAGTRQTLSIVWGTRELAAEHLARSTAGYRARLERAGLQTSALAR